MRALVAMLLQTDRFGTSVAQALRTHAQKSAARSGDNLAEEKAEKVSVKLVFPLVFRVCSPRSTSCASARWHRADLAERCC